MASNPEAERARRLRWYKAGADAIHNVLRWEDPPHQRRLYMCPLCGQFHDQDSIDSKELTDEHVPPEAVGGKKLVLTCDPCNNTAGTKLDWHAGAQLRTIDLLRLERGVTPVQFAPQVNGRLEIVDRTLLFSTDIRHCHRDRFHDFHDDLNRRISAANAARLDRMPLFTFWLPMRHDDRRANISYLRAAYLSAFAKFGYRLILSPSYQLIRRQIRDFGDTVIPALPVGRASGNQAAMFNGHLPGLGNCLVVRFGERWVALPARPNDVEWWDRLVDVAMGSAVFRVDQVLRRPRWPELLQDRQAPPPPGPDWTLIDFFGERRAA